MDSSTDEVFFINVMPPSDRWVTKDYKEIIHSFVMETTKSSFDYTLVAIGDTRFDPWSVSQYAMGLSPTFSPLIAVNPFYQAPSQVAKQVSTLQNLYANKIAINLVSGSYFNQLEAAGDHVSHVERNARLVEFLKIQKDLLSKTARSDFKGRYYELSGISLTPKSTVEATDFFISGGFSEKVDFKQQGLFFIRNTLPLHEVKQAQNKVSGLCLGLCVRETEAEALKAVQDLFPENRRGKMLFELSLNNTETPWNRWMKEYLKSYKSQDLSFYLEPMMNLWSSAPFIVGSYEQAAKQIRSRIQLGYQFFLIDFHPDDFMHVGNCLDLVRR